MKVCAFGDSSPQLPPRVCASPPCHGLLCCSQLLGKLQSLPDRGTRGTGSSAHLPLLREVLQLLDVPLA